MKILICNKAYKQAENVLMSALSGHELISCAPDDVANHLNGVDILLPSVAHIDSEIISKGSFGFIQQLGVGLDSVDIDAASAAGVMVANVPGAGSGNAESVAELAILFMLSLSRRIDKARNNLSSGIFFQPTGAALLNKSVCILGLGDIGKALAVRLRPFDLKLSAVRQDPSKGAPVETGIGKVYGLNDLHKAIAEVDFVVLALPETKATKDLIDQNAFKAMKAGSFLINVARGGIVDKVALLQSLESGHLGGAALDVFWEEPADPQDPIFKFANVIATPHIGGNTDESFKGVARAMIENIKLYAAGKTPLNLVNNPVSLRASITKAWQ